MIVPAAVVTFALGTSFQTNAFKAGNSYMAYAEVDPGTVTVTGITSGNVRWTLVGRWEASGKEFSLWHGTAVRTGRSTDSVQLSGPYTGSVELGWQQFKGPSQIASVGALQWTGTTMRFPQLGQGYLWEYGKSDGVAICQTSRCTQTPQQNIVISGTFTTTPQEAANVPGGFSEGVKLTG
jgi:hypothetical protein